MRTVWKLVLVLVLLLSMASTSQSAAPAGYSEYYLPGDEGNLNFILGDLDTATPDPNTMHAIINVTAWTADTTVYYDHWENGYGFDPANPAATADETVFLANAGDQRIFESSGMVLPRTSATTYYDGGDRIYVAGGTVTVSRTSFVDGRGVGNQGVAWEIYPLQPQLTTYVLPFGENLGFADFTRVYVLIQATEDNTTFSVDLDGTGGPDILNQNRDNTWNNAGDSATVTLDRGETFLLDRISACRDHVTCTSAPVTLNAGALIQGDKTLQVKFVAGAAGNLPWIARGYSVFPRGFWTKDYYAPLDDPASTENTDYYLFNPNPTAAITVAWESRTATGSFSIPANTTVSFRTVAGGGAVPTDSGLYFKGTDVFWGVGSNNVGGTNTGRHEWGYSLLPSTMLYDEHFLGWAPGYDMTAGAQPATQWDNVGIFVTPAQDNTRVFVDYDNDGTPDQTYTLDRLQTQFVYDTVDGNLSQARIWATGKFSMAYGQNSDLAPDQTYGMDIGYVAIPGNDFVSLVLAVDKSVSPQVVSTASDSVATFTIKVNSHQYTVDGVSVLDYLPPNWQYLAGTDTTSITWPDRTLHAIDPLVSGVAATGQTLSWTSADLGTDGNPGMAENQEVTITFTARTTAILAVGTLSQNRVKAVGTRTFGSPSQTQTFTTSDFVYVTSGNMEITKTSSAANPLYPGDQFSYTVIATNPSTAAFDLTGISLYDPLPSGVSYVAGSGSVTCEMMENVRDEFATASYTNNDGTANWAGPWTETDSQGGGAASGLVSVTGGGLRFQVGSLVGNANDPFTTNNTYDGGTGWPGPWTEENDGGGTNYSSGTIQLSNANNRLEFIRSQLNDAIRRTVNVAGATSITVSFDFTDAGIDNGEFLDAEYSSDGVTFTNLQHMDRTSGTRTSTFAWNPANSTITLRFRAFNSWDQANDIAYIDNVNIAFSQPVTASGSLIQRSVDLTSATAPLLDLVYSSAGLGPGDTLVVGASDSATGTFVTLATFTGGVPDVPPPYDLASFISTTSSIQFLATGGFNTPGQAFDVNYVDISYPVTSTIASGNPPQFLQNSAGGCFISPGSSLSLTYFVTVDNPLTAGIGEITNTAYINSNEIILPLSASVTNLVVNPSSTSASVGDRVWLDSNSDGTLDLGEPGLANVEVTLKDRFGTPLMTTTTDATGHYLFAGITADNGYFVELTAATIPAGLQQSTPAGYTNRTAAFNLAAGQVYDDADLGYEPAAGTATIGTYVWSDANADNRRNGGEPGIANVTVELWLDLNGDGLKDTGDALCTVVACGVAGTTATAPDGSYLFSGVTAGGTQDYLVFVDETQTALTGYTRTSPPSGDALYAIIDFGSGASYLSANFGYQGTTYSITDRVWFDPANAGTLDSGELGIGGVTVDLLDTSLNTIATTTTAADGTFTFTGVAGGGADYTLMITDTANVLADYFGTTSSAQSGFRPVDNFTADLDFADAPSFGYNLSRAIGDTVFNDNGAGGGTAGNGSQDGGEPGLPGVTVRLFRDDGDSVFEPGAGDGAPVATLATDANGRYVFAGLSTATYWVQVDGTQAALTGYLLTTADAALNAAGHWLVEMSGSNTLGIDYGYQATSPHSVSGTVWEDFNKDGVIDISEARLAGVTIDLLDAGQNVIATTATSAAGEYGFSGVPSGNPYYVRITDTSAVLTGYICTWEVTAPFDGQETVDLRSSDVTDLNFGFFTVIPTRVMLAHFGAVERNGNVVVQWTTASERETLGFNLLRLDPIAGAYVKINPDLLPGVHQPHRGGRYSFKDVGASPGVRQTYKLVEVEIFGREIPYGPFTIVAGRFATPRRDVVAAGADLPDGARFTIEERHRSDLRKLRMSARLSGLTPEPLPTHGKRVKISVTEPGLYYLSALEIGSFFKLSADRAASLIGAGRLSLSTQGLQVAYLPAAGNAGLYFYGVGLDSIYTKENVYWLDNKAPGTLMTVRQGSAPEPSAAENSYTETLHLEQDLISWETLFEDPAADYWFWDQIFASSAYTDPARTFTFRPSGLDPAQTTATLRLHLLGASDAGVANDHHVIMSVNGQSVEGWWSGLSQHTISGTFTLQEGENTVTVRGTADPGVSSSFVLIDSFDVTYQRRHEAAGDALFFRADQAQPVTVGGFSSPEIMVFDLTDPLRPQRDGAAAVGAAGGFSTVGVTPLAADTPYLAVAGSGVKAAAARAVSASRLVSRGNRADYVIIVPADLAVAARSLAAYRREQGLLTKVVKLEDVMNEFNHGISSPEAIRTFLSFTRSHWKRAPRYVVLAGDGSMDYKNNLGFGGSLIPSLMVPTDFGLAISDNRLADVNGDHIPEFAIGRLPVVNPGELNAVVAKIKTFERNHGNTNVVLVADFPDEGGSFIADSESLAALFPAAYTLNAIYLENPSQVNQKRADLIGAVNGGVGLVNFVGHAGPDQLSNWGLFSYYPYPEYDPPADDVALLTNASMLPVLTAQTCGLNNFADPYQDVLGEALLLKPDGGIAASWSATGLSDNAAAGLLNRAFYEALLTRGKPVLGDVVRQAIAAYRQQGGVPYMTDIYTILGDPALRMR